jgi:hypothetical protein
MPNSSSQILNNGNIENKMVKQVKVQELTVWPESSLAFLAGEAFNRNCLKLS